MASIQRCQLADCCVVSSVKRHTFVSPAAAAGTPGIGNWLATGVSSEHAQGEVVGGRRAARAGGMRRTLDSRIVHGG